jgi:hypothetical protein
VQTTVGVRGEGFTFRVPGGWRVSAPRDSVVARSGSALVSVTRFPLLKAYDPANFGAVAKQLDRIATQLAGGSLDAKETTTVAGERVRAYRYGDQRLAFVLDGRREYQLFCRRAGDACDLLFSSFKLS